MAKIFIATPAFSGQTHVLYTIALAETCTALSHAGHDTVIRIHSSGSLLVAERNNLNDAFLRSDCTHMLCIDSDLAWRYDAVLAMLHYDKDFIVGCYPARKKPDVFHFIPDENEDGTIKTDGPLIKLKYAPAGFMLLKRRVLEKMTEFHKDQQYEPIDENSGETPGCALFNTEIVNGAFWGEDYVFCRRAREAGFDIWCDPRFVFNHADTVGCLASKLTQDKTMYIKPPQGLP